MLMPSIKIPCFSRAQCPKSKKSGDDFVKEKTVRIILYTAWIVITVAVLITLLCLGEDRVNASEPLRQLDRFFPWISCVVLLVISFISGKLYKKEHSGKAE